MTIPRVLLAAALMVMGLVIWNIRENMAGLRTELSTFSQQMTEAGTKIVSVMSAPKPTPVCRLPAKKKPVGIIHKPTVAPVPYTPTQPNLFDMFFNPQRPVK